MGSRIPIFFLARGSSLRELRTPDSILKVEISDFTLLGLLDFILLRDGKGSFRFSTLGLDDGETLLENSCSVGVSGIL